MTTPEPAISPPSRPRQDYGKVRDAWTLEIVRDATAIDWLRTMERVGAGHPEGAWKDDTGRVVYVAGGPQYSLDVAKAIAEAGVV